MRVLILTSSTGGGHNMRARSFIFNFVRNYGDLEHVNIGRVAASLSHRGAYAGRRGVYLAEIKQRNSPQAILRIIRCIPSSASGGAKVRNT